ncbi:VacJ family lipoprotein [Ottowia sp. GY511]|nr:VacJ family lipoprotein [Ottowia sp. GY511]
MSERTPGTWRPIQTMASVTALALAAGCATAPSGDDRDPWEPYNRSMTKFNDAVDNAVLKPVATAYRDVLPQPVRTGVGNFFGNLSDAWSFVNNVLQGKPEGSLHSFWRVVVNSTVGLGGVLDPATEMRLERRREDFGQTLGRWGVPPGPYFVIPLLGPSTVRDTAALPVDFYGHPLGHMHDVAWRNSLAGLNIVNTRAAVLGATDLLDSAALDPYTFKRDAFLQRRQNDVYDGNPPQDEERYDLEEGETSPSAPSGATPGTAPGKRPTRRPRRPRPTSEAPMESPATIAAEADASVDQAAEETATSATQTLAWQVPASGADVSE